MGPSFNRTVFVFLPACSLRASLSLKVLSWEILIGLKKVDDAIITSPAMNCYANARQKT